MHNKPGRTKKYFFAFLLVVVGYEIVVIDDFALFATVRRLRDAGTA